MTDINFYTNVSFHKGRILLKGFDNGKRIQTSIPYQPYLFVQSNDTASPYKTIFGAPVERVDFRTVGAARDYINKYKDVSNYDIYGMTQWIYPFIYDKYATAGAIPYDRSKVKILFLDIETETGKYDDQLEVCIRKNETSPVRTIALEQIYKYPDYEIWDIKYDKWTPVLASCYILDVDFPKPEEATKEINSITFRIDGKNIVLGFYDYTPEDRNTTYIKCENEIELLRKIISIIRQIDPAIVTGWNSAMYDIPYITNRITRILGEETAKELSPWGIIERKMIHDKFGHDYEVITWVGISSIDYIDTYKKFESATEEAYALDYISEVQLGVGKLDYSEYGSLRGLYMMNRPLYYKYNIIDVERLTQIEEKLKLFDVQLSLAYYMGVNYIDVFGTVRPWDAFIHGYLMRQGIVVPQSEIGEQEDKIEGAHVKLPKPGIYNWVVSFDVKSLYPSLARQCNISPETFIGTAPDISVLQILNKAVDKSFIKQLKDENASLCGTGCLFDNTVEGFIAACMRLTYEERVVFQAEYKKFNKLKNETDKSDPKYAEYVSLTAYYRAQQQSRKIAINSLYGAFASRFFRWYDRRLAESITKTGQIAIQQVAAYINKFLNWYCGTKDVDYVVYIDTDSNYIELKAVVDKNGWNNLTNSEIAAKLNEFSIEKLKPVIDKAFDDLFDYLNHRTKVLDMARENIASRAIWTDAKKRYAMMVYDSEGTPYDPPKPKIQGHEAVRGSTPRELRKLLKEAIIILLMEDEEAVQLFVEKTESEFNNLPFEVITYNKNCNNLAKYTNEDGSPAKKTPINVRAAIVYNHMLRKHELDTRYPLIEEGNKIKYCHLIMPNPTNSNVIGAPYELPRELHLEEYIDYRTMFEKAFIKPMSSLTDAAGWTIEKVENLSDLFED